MDKKAPTPKIQQYDHQIQAMSGMMDVNGDPDGPDAGRCFRRSRDAAFSILAALRHRDQTGEGRI